MKNRVVRVACAVMLSALMTVTTAIPVLAACGNSHTIVNGEVRKVYIHADANMHRVEEITTGRCTECGEVVSITNTYDRAHTPDANGVCTECRYQVWYRP